MAKKIVLGVLLLGMTGMTTVSWAGDAKVSQLDKDLCRKVVVTDLEKLNSPVVDGVLSRNCGPMTAPEMDPSSAIVGLTLLMGGVAVIRGRRMQPRPPTT